MYLSTIETLAMAVDAKDQITHGHIRRVQVFAVELAKRLGVKDSQQLKAIEAAALLHDMGKLAIPEHILNKPGKLNGPEFEQMKLHATIGADILSSIDFPYPVVPIVRHHHENWDGTGYPTGLCGTDIPIGARILSVVDCFDALTSDRPYRPRLSDDQAIQILEERRGQMYDPLIVDTFVRVHERLANQYIAATAPREALREISQSVNRSASPTDAATYEAMDQAFVDDVTRKLDGAVPFSCLVVFLYDITSDSIKAKYTSRPELNSLKKVSIRRGQRLSGWVAANRRTILNSDPKLDLCDSCEADSLALRSSLSTPIAFGEHLVGVLTLYSTKVDVYDDSHAHYLESAATNFAEQVIAKRTVSR